MVRGNIEFTDPDKLCFSCTVTCILMQKVGAGLHATSSCVWDPMTDGCCTVKWENKTIYCMVTVFGLAI